MSSSRGPNRLTNIQSNYQKLIKDLSKLTNNQVHSLNRNAIVTYVNRYNTLVNRGNQLVIRALNTEKSGYQKKLNEQIRLLKVELARLQRDLQTRRRMQALQGTALPNSVINIILEELRKNNTTRRRQQSGRRSSVITPKRLF